MILESGQFHRARSAVEKRRMEQIKALDREEYLAGQKNYTEDFQPRAIDFLPTQQEEQLKDIDDELREIEDRDG